QALIPRSSRSSVSITLGIALLCGYRAAGFFLRGMVCFVGQHPFFGAATAAALLAADFFDARALGGDVTFLLLLNFVQQQAASQKAVESLMACRLAFDLEACRAVKQHDAGGAFIDVLAAVTAGSNEGFFNV